MPKKSAINLSTEAGREKLRPRQAPYFTKIGKRKYLGYRRTKEGGTWVARFQIGATRSFHNLGADALFANYEAALKSALIWFETVDAGGVIPANGTLEDAVQSYLRHLTATKNKDAATRTRQSLNKHIPVELSRTKLAQLTHAHLKTWFQSLVKDDDDDEIKRRSKDTANRVWSMLRAALNLAFIDGHIGSDAAWRRVKPFKDVGRAREVFLSKEQCRILLDACDKDFRELAQSALLIGGRYEETAVIRVRHLDLDKGLLHIPKGKTGTRNVTLSDEGIDHFRSLAYKKAPSMLIHQKKEGAEYIAWGKSMQHRPMKEAVKRANEIIEDEQKQLPGKTVFYSLRHTYASFALLAGVNIQVLAENMGTSVRMIEKHYGKFLQTDRRAMFNSVTLT